MMPWMIFQLHAMVIQGQHTCAAATVVLQKPPRCQVQVQAWQDTCTGAAEVASFALLFFHLAVVVVLLQFPCNPAGLS